MSSWFAYSKLSLLQPSRSFTQDWTQSKQYYDRKMRTEIAYTDHETSSEHNLSTMIAWSSYCVSTEVKVFPSIQLGLEHLGIELTAMSTQWNTSQWKIAGLMFWNHSLRRYMYVHVHMKSSNHNSKFHANKYIKQLRLPDRLCWSLASLCEPQVTCSYQDAWWSQRELCGGLKLLFHNILPKPPIEHVYWKAPPPTVYSTTQEHVVICRYPQ